MARQRRLWAVRGAVTCAEDTREEIVSRSQLLLKELMARNGIRPPDVVSVIFTATGDLRSEFPAAAARLMGLDVPLLCARELDVDSGLALPRCIRVLLHYYGTTPPQPVYLDDAARLREPPDPVS